jgi:hypothetical protein
VPGIGTLQYVRSPDHEHWHYLGFDRYEVYELRRAGKPRILVFDQKTGFCLGDRYPMTPVSVAGAQPLPLFIGSCGLGKPELLDIVEGISVGWGDDYRAFLEGQDLALDGLPGGRYELIHRVNSDRKLRELSYANNAASLLLDLRWTSAGPTVRVLASCPDTERCPAP